MSLLVAKGIEKAWGQRLVLKGCDLVVRPGEVVGLVGPNGCGKSTLLSIVGGAEGADAGTVEVHGRAELLAQDPVLHGATVGEAVAEALGWHRDLHAAWDAALAAGELTKAATLQDQLDHAGWDLDHRIEEMLGRVDAPPRTASTAKLSGGERRRVALARTLLANPDLLLLDEPTNHLDAATIDWLQGWIAAFTGAVVIVTHDRYLLEAVATRIVEIEEGVAVSYDGSYADFLVAQAERRASLRRADDARLALLAREAEWASRSPAARTTKQRARLDRLDALKAQERLPKDPRFELDLSTGLKQGQTVIEAHGLKKSFGDRVLFDKLELSLLRGERLGILGPNGAGKSTLLHLVAGHMQPDKGTLRLAPRVKVAVLDQHRTGLKETDTVFEAAGGGTTHVTVGGEQVHVAGFLQRFLFPTSMHGVQVASLSGGERARLLLARMMLHGANLLLLDEPTNDLDLMTLRVLEEALLSFDGAALIVTHDRAFLDRVCSSVIAFEPGGHVTRYASRQQAQRAEAEQLAAAAGARRAEAEVAARIAKPKAPPATTKLSWKDKQELAALPDRIAALEAEIAALHGRLAEPGVWSGDQGRKLTAELEAKEAALATAWERWEALEGAS